MLRMTGKSTQGKASRHKVSLQWNRAFASVKFAKASEMLQTQREIFAKAKVINNKHKIVGAIHESTENQSRDFACMESFLERMESFKECMKSHFCVYGQAPDDP